MVLLSLLLLLTACQPKQFKLGADRISHEVPQSAAEIHLLMQQAEDGDNLDLVLAELNLLSREADTPIREEALFREVQLLLENRRPEAAAALNIAVQQYPDHALAPYAALWAGKWWLKQDESGRALEWMKWSLQHKRLTRELAEEIFDIAPAVARDAPESVAVSWFLVAAAIQDHRRDNWLRLAARRASLETIEQIHNDGSLSRELMPQFDLHAGRARLMTGDREAVKRIAELASASMPRHAVASQLRAWASGEFRAATIGVMLPLSGSYARYGEEALRGIRMALADVGSDAYITLRVEDTAGSAKGAVAAYKRLAEESVNMMIGPLLSETTEALVPYLKPGLPVVSLTGHIDLAQQSGSLFVHTISPLAQVQLMADYAWQHGAQRVAVISDASADQVEADMFTKYFESFGGEVVHALQLDSTILDQRERLRELRYETDDEELLAELDDELHIMLPKMEMELKLPIGFDAVYLALNGKQVSLLAGQLAYAGIRDIPIYGSGRWQDGHLMDDRGRYLYRARFPLAAISPTFQDTDDSAFRRFRFAHREAWGSDQITDLMTLAYDTVRIAVVMSSRLGLSTSRLTHELHHMGGFPAMTGHVQFDGSGVGQKQLDIFRIRRGKVIPAG